MKKYLHALGAAILIGAAVFALCYTRPQTITELCPSIDFRQLNRIHGYYYIYDGSNKAGNDVSFELTQDDNAFAAVLDSLEEREFRRSLRSLLPERSKSHMLENGDYKWDIILTFDTLSFPDGSVSSGDVLRIGNFFGQLTVYCNDESWRCSTDGQAAWIESIIQHIQAKEA